MKNVKKGHSCPVVCLDAGHCGKENRSPVASDFYESEVNWKLHNFLAERLEAYGISVRKTRKDQKTDMELTARGKQSKDADLFLSLHVNAAENANANYILGIHMVEDGCGEIDAQSKQVAELLANAVAAIMGAKPEAWTKRSSSDRDGNGYKDDYYGVLRGAHSVGTPGAIIEHGFYTNRAQAEFLLSDENLKKLAEAEAAALADWFGLQQKEQGSSLIGNPYKLELVSIRRGSRGAQVEALQALLICRGHSCGKSGIDGSLGPETESSLKQFQSAMGLDADGIAGPATMKALLGYR